MKLKHFGDPSKDPFWPRIDSLSPIDARPKPDPDDLVKYPWLAHVEETLEGSWSLQRVIIDGRSIHCPSHALMDVQVEHDGIKRGSRVISCTGGRTGTALSVYRWHGSTDRHPTFVHVMFDSRGAQHDTDGGPITMVRLLDL